MQPNTKLVNLELDYELSAAEDKDLVPKKGENAGSVANITRNLINQAFTGNYAQGMDDKTAKAWRVIRRVLDHAIDSDEGRSRYALFSSSDFDRIYEEVYNCKYNPMMARFVPYFYDELDIVKRRSDEEESVVQDAKPGLKIAGK